MNHFLAMFATFGSGQVVAIVLLTVFILTIWSIKTFILNKLTFIDISLATLIFILCLFVNLSKPLIIILIIFSSLNLVYSLFTLVAYTYIKEEVNKRTVEYVKNTEYDFFIQMDNKERITDCSISLLKMTHSSKKDVLHYNGWKYIFDNFDIRSINKQEFTLNYVATFLSEFKECNSKHKRYKFQMEVEMKNKDNPGEIDIVRFDGIIQPVYVAGMVVARNVFFYQDKMYIVEKLKNTVRSACTDLEDAYLQIDMIMSLSEGIIMYYDFQNKVYVATECMRLYTNTTKKEYTFEEIFSHIHPEDVRSYIDQAETVNSLSVTKIKYRLLIGDVYYQVEEDSIYMRKDYGLVSIIRIAEKSVRESMPQNAKVKKEIDILNNLANRNIKSTLDKTIDLLNVVLGDKDEQ